MATAILSVASIASAWRGARLRATPWPFGLLLVLAAIVPSMFFATLAWKERTALLQEGEQLARRTTTALTEHALGVVEMHALLLNQVDAQLRLRPWWDIEGDVRLQHSLDVVVQRIPHVRSIMLVDAEGLVRLRSPRANGIDVAVADREHFAAHRGGRVGSIHIGAPIDNRLNGERLFTISMRRTTPSGAFDGIIATAVPLGHFTRFWEQFAPSVDHVIPLMRADGTMLARYPAGHPRKLPASAPFMRQIAEHPFGGFYVARSQVDGVERMNAFSRIGTYPLYVSFSLETKALLAPWRQRAALYALLALLATAALVTLVLMGMRQARDGQLSAQRWREVAERLQLEMERRQQAESELVQAQKMEAVGQLTGGLAHDFNNLLSAMGLSLHLAERAAGDGPVARHLRNVRHALERGTQLTRQLTMFARRQPLEPRVFSLRTLVAGTADLLARTLGGNIALDVDIPEDVRPVHADPAQTEQALLNLALNARDAMPGGGRLTIRARNLEVGEPGHGLAVGRYVELVVADSGCGMPPDVAARAFEPFFTTKEVGRGSGLGLSMVQGFATQSGGRVTLHSRPGQGTQVSLVLPSRDGAGGDTHTGHETTARSSAAGGRVLVVDDDALVRESLRETLREAGYEVVVAGSGAQALERLREGPPYELLATDYAMPDMSGAALARQARQLHPAMPILLLTGHAEPALAELPPGVADAVLHKPFTQQELVARLEPLLASARTRGGAAG